MKQIKILIVSVVLCLAAGGIGGLFTASAILNWYADLTKPSFNPPNSVFAPVWTALYILIGVSLALVWNANWRVNNKLLTSGKKPWNKWSERFWMGDLQKQNIIAIFAVQLVLNVLWSYIFFGKHSIGLALADILALWFAILYTIINFYRVSKPAAFILVPYILWVTFAAYLNYAIWMLNL